VAGRTDPRADFDEFVAVCWGRLLRTSCLLTGDRAEAERLLQHALAKARVDWSRLDRQPELYVRRVLVEATGPWWKDRAARRRSAVLVLRFVDDLSEEDTAELLGVSIAMVRNVAEAAGGPNGPAVQALRERLAGLEPASARAAVPDLRTGVDREVAVLRRVRRGLAVTAVLAVLAGVGTAVALAAGLAGAGSDAHVHPTPSIVNVLPTPPLLAGYQLSPLLSVADIDYEYVRSTESLPGKPRLRVLLPASRLPEALAWVSPPSLGGDIVVLVDGYIARRDPAGSFQSGLLLSSRRAHVVELRATRPDVSMRLGLAVYRWPPA
jgi:Sigma-70, region 4